MDQTAIRDLGIEYDDRLPKAPPLTNAQMEFNDAEQAKRASRFTVNPNDLATMRANAAVNELSSIPRNDLNERQVSQYADALAVLGRYDDAFEISGDDRYKEIWEAVWDASPCDCLDYETVVLQGNKPVKQTYSRRFKKANIYSAKLKAWANLMQCNDCGTLCVEPR